MVAKCPPVGDLESLLAQEWALICLASFHSGNGGDPGHCRVSETGDGQGLLLCCAGLASVGVLWGPPDALFTFLVEWGWDP